MTETVQLTIGRLGVHGDGMARHNDTPLAVPFTLDGETVQAEIFRGKKQVLAKLRAVITPHPQRQTPPCHHFTDCGGCRLQHAMPDFYHAWKRGIVRHALEKAGLSHPCDALFTTPARTRRRANISARKTDGRIILGFHARGSPFLVDLKECHTLHPDLFALFPSLRAFLGEVLSDRDRLDIHLTLLDGAREAVFNGHVFEKDAEKKMADWGIANGLASVYVRQKKTGLRLVMQTAPLTARYGEFSVTLPPGGFLQASHESERAMLDFIAPHMEGVAAFADLFCGARLFSLSFMKKGMRVLAADVDARSVGALQQAARGAHGIRAETCNLFDAPFPAAAFTGMDAVIIDPPRAGAEAQMRELAACAAGKIISISCNPQSFARDGALLAEKGWRLTDLKIFDQFLWSDHVEVIGIFEK